VTQLNVLPLQREFKVFKGKNSENSWFRLVICSEGCNHAEYPLIAKDSNFKHLVGPDSVRLHSPYKFYYHFALEIFNFLNSTDIFNHRFHFEFGGKPRGHYYLVRLLIWTGLNNSQFCDFNNIKFEETSANFLTNHMDRFVLESIKNWNLKNKYPNQIYGCSQEGCPSSKRPEISAHFKHSMDIVIPTKGVTAIEILRCLDSIERQIVDGDQIYLVDDNEFEQQELLEIAKKSSYIHLIKGDNSGVASARNRGLNAGKNGIVSFVDSDDYVLPGYFDIQRKFHISNPEIAATGTWLQGFGNSSTVYPQWDGINPLGLLMCLPPAGVLTWKRSVLAENQFDLSFGVGFEDFDLVARVIAKNYTIAVFDFPLYMYQRGHTSLSQSWSSSVEQVLRSKVNSNVNQLCRHKLTELFSLVSVHGRKLLVSHPDLVFRINVQGQKKFDFSSVITTARKSKVLRKIWTVIPEGVRFKIFAKLTNN
jgi:glycosyltransferase involved in cell wall biosynthesis